jgi:hypothetical protein
MLAPYLSRLLRLSVNPARDELPEGWEEPPTGGTDRAQNGTSRSTDSWPAPQPPARESISPRTQYLSLAGLIVLGATVDTWSSYDIAARAGRHYSVWLPVIWEVTSVIAILALLPVLKFGFRIVRAPNRHLLLSGVLGAALVVLFSLMHLGAMSALRVIAYRVLGEPYRFGSEFDNFIYEFRKDTLACVVILTGFFLFDRLARPAPVASAPSVVEGVDAELWLRDGPTRIRVSPAEVLWVASAGNYVEYVLAGGQRHLIRGTLGGEGERLAGFGIVRVHRTRLVNLKRVVTVVPRDSGDLDLRLDTGDLVICSRSYRTRLPAALRG